MTARKHRRGRSAWLGAGAALICAVALQGCVSSPTRTPIRTAEYVDLDRFMGDWYVIANIPTAIEKGAHNAVEGYRIDADGSIATTFTFRRNGFDGERKVYTPRGFVMDRKSNAVWGMQFVWPVKADYRIVWLDDAYSQTVIGRNARDYVWIMARQPTLPEADYRRIVDFLGTQGYDVSKIQKVPQRWD
jgi:apolipoprotein D and lipocalin family protein